MAIAQPQLKAIRALIEERVEQGGFSGVVLVKQGDTELIHDAHGFAHRGFAVPNSTGMRFDTASVAKVFTGALALHLADLGRIDLDTPVIPFLGIADTPISHAVTVRHCLNHASGIADDADEEAGEDYELLFVDTPNYSIRNAVDFLPQFIHKEPMFAPGEGVRYNNVGFILAGLVMEKITGLDHRDAVRQYVFDRAGMDAADFLATDEINHNLAEHYKRIEGDDDSVVWRKNIYSYPPVGSPADGATVTALDLDRFIRAVVEGRLLSPQSTALMTTPQVISATSGDAYGFGMQFRHDDQGTVLGFGKDGINAGVASIFEYLPALDTTVVLLANQDCNVWSLKRQIVTALATPDEQSANDG